MNLIYDRTDAEWLVKKLYECECNIHSNRISFTNKFLSYQNMWNDGNKKIFVENITSLLDGIAQGQQVICDCRQHLEEIIKKISR